MSVGFADTDKDYSNYLKDSSSVGVVYIPKDDVEIVGDIRIRYEKHPWIERFEVDGVIPAPVRRTGYGTKNFKGFVQSLNTIYVKAYSLAEEVSDSGEYFAKVTKDFVESSRDLQREKIFCKFCGYTENLWREGDKEMHDVAMLIVLPTICADEHANELFERTITDEFRNYIREYN